MLSIYFVNVLFACSKDIPDQAIVQRCDLLAGHLTWLFVVMYKVMHKMSESEKVDHSGIYTAILISSCDIIETVTLSRPIMMVMGLAKRVANTGNASSWRQYSFIYIFI